MIKFIEPFKLTKFLRILVPQNLRALNNGLPCYACNDEQFTVNRSLFTQAAFTLAETLIVIGILGVVAALTLPNLNHATGDKERITKVNKAYSSLTDAFDRAQAVYGPFDEWFKNDTTEREFTDRMGNRLAEFMKISKICKDDNDKSCFTIKWVVNPITYRFHLADGTGVRINCRNNSSEITCGIVIGIDGNKGKGWYGYDMFSFGTKKTSIEPTEIPWGGSGLFNDTHIGASRWIIDYGNMDYLKADLDGVCPDGKTVLDGTTNTSCH